MSSNHTLASVKFMWATKNTEYRSGASQMEINGIEKQMLFFDLDRLIALRNLHHSTPRYSRCIKGCHGKGWQCPIRSVDWDAFLVVAYQSFVLVGFR